jgi:hypothetical protein
MMRHLIHLIGLLALAAAVSLPGCGGSSPDRKDRTPSPKTDIVAPRKASENIPTDGRRSAPRSALNNNERHLTKEPAWLTAECDDPDPSVRLQAIEAWAREPEETLDPLTYALVDPDESVRARAQEFLEEALARR